MALIDKASLLMVPSTYEAGTLYNVLPSGNRAPDSTDQNSGYDQTRADFTFDRGSNAAATRVNASGLIEKYRENLLTYSNDFSNGVWAKSNLSVALSNGAWEVTDNTTSGSHYLYWGGTTPASSVLTLSVEAKAGAEDYLVMRLGGFTYAFFNVANGTLGTIHSSFIDAKIEATSDGFYRCSATILTPSSGSASVFYPSNNSSNVSYTGTGAIAITIKNAQLESGLVASSYLDSTSVTGKAGVLVDLPRINYDANGENGALLLEPSRANKITNSEYINTTTFDQNTGVTINNNEATSPEGFDNAAKIIATTATSRHELKTSLATPNGTDMVSCFVKASGYNYVQIASWADPANYVNFDLTDGSIGSVGLNGPTIKDIEDYGNGWYRIHANVQASGGGVFGIGIVTSASAEWAESFTGNGTDGLLIWGAQLEPNASYPSSYIPTMGTSETRAADSCSVTGVSDVIGQTEGTLFWEVEKIVDGFDYYQVSDGGTNNWILVGIDSGNVLAYIKTGGAVQVSTGSPMSVGRHKIALAYAANDVVLYLDGVQVGSDTSVSIPATNEIALSQGNPAGAKGISTKTFQCALFKERLSNAELAALTA